MADNKLDNDPIFTLDSNTLWAIYFFVILGMLTLPGALITGKPLVLIAWAAQLVLQTILLLIALYSRSRADREAYDQVLALYREVNRLKASLDA